MANDTLTKQALTLSRRLRHSMITASNDDLSERGTEKRNRYVARFVAMGDAATFLEEVADDLADTAIRAVTPVSENDRHYLNAIKHRLEMLYELVEDTPRVREHISDEIDWVEDKLAFPSGQSNEGA